MSRLPLAEIVDLDRYPIHELDSDAGRALVEHARSALQAVGACDLRGFLRPEAIEAAVASALSVHDRAYRTEQTHDIEFSGLAAEALAARRSAAHAHPLGQGGHGARRHPGRFAGARAVRVGRADRVRRPGARGRADLPLRGSARRAQLHVLRARRRARLALRRRRLRRHAAAAGVAGGRHVRVRADAAQRGRPQRRGRALAARRGRAIACRRCRARPARSRSSAATGARTA